MANFGVYTPYETLKEYLSIPAAQVSDDKLLSAFTEQASRKFDAFCHGRHFYPIRQARSYDAPASPSPAFGGYYNSWNSTFPNIPPITVDNTLLELDDDLLEVATLTTNNGSTTISDYLLMTGSTYNFPPYDKIQLKSDGAITEFSFSGTPQSANTVTGTWGYHEQWGQAWQDSQDTVENNPLSDSGTSITINDVDGANLFGFTPLFQYQQLLRIESEYVYVTGKNTTTNTLTVIRGVNGTTAAAHVQNTPIYIYQPMAEIVLAMLTLATYAYRRKDNVGRDSDRGSTALGIVQMPAKLPADVTDILDIYKRWTKS